MIKVLKNLGKKELFFAFLCLVFIFSQVWLELKIPDYMSKITVLVKTPGTGMKDVLEQGLYMTLCALGSLVTSIIVGYFASFIAAKLKEGFDSSLKTTLIMNADDPLCSFIEHENRTIYYSIEKTKEGFISHNVNDFPVCPKCYNKIDYLYQHYRHIGKVKCSNCGFESLKGDYVGSNIDYDKNTFIVKHNNKETEYKIISKSLFNVFNELSVIALFSDMGYSDEVIKEAMNDIKVPKTRENFIEVCGKKIDLQVSKGQNGSSSSTIFEHISNINENIEIVLLLNDMGCINDKSETVTWIYETDFFFLNKPNIKRIIVGDYLANDYKTAMLLNGIDEEKIFIAKDDLDTVNYVTFDGIDRIMILFDVEYITGSLKIRDKIVEKLEGEKHEG